MKGESSGIFSKMDINEIIGTLSYKEYKFLSDLSGKIKGDGVIVEIGSWKGKGAIYMANGLNKKTKIYSIDPLNDIDENIIKFGLSDTIIHIKDIEENVIKNWSMPIELLFIDAHYYDYELTKKLLANWSKYIVMGGVIALNNVCPSFYGIFNNKPFFGLPKIKKAMFEFIGEFKNFNNFKSYGCIGYATKCKERKYIDNIKCLFTVIKIELLYVFYRIYKILSFLYNSLKRMLRIKQK